MEQNLIRYLLALHDILLARLVRFKVGWKQIDLRRHPNYLHGTFLTYHGPQLLPPMGDLRPQIRFLLYENLVSLPHPIGIPMPPLLLYLRPLVVKVQPWLLG